MSEMKKVVKSEQEWQRQLTPEQYEVCRRKGTERPFSGEYNHCKDTGMYRCACCGQAAVQFRRQIRLRHRLAKLLRAGRRGGGQDRRGLQPVRQAAHRSIMQRLRRTPGPRLPRRPATHGPAVLHQFRGPGPGEGRVNLGQPKISVHLVQFGTTINWRAVSWSYFFSNGICGCPELAHFRNLWSS